MAHIGKFLTLVALLIAVTGCASVQPPPKDMFAGYPFRHDDFDFRYGWKVGPLGNGIVVDGIVMNVRYFQVTDMQLTLKVLNKEKKVLVQESTLFVPYPLESYGTRPFSVKLDNVALTPGDMLTFSLFCRIDEDNKGSSTWLSIFTVDALTGAARDTENPGAGY